MESGLPRVQVKRNLFANTSKLEFTCIRGQGKVQGYRRVVIVIAVLLLP